MYNWLQKNLKLAHHSHSGRLLPRAHTSNGALLVLMLAAGVMLAFATRGLVASADTLESGSLNLSGTVPGPPPSQAAVILQPTEGQVLTSSPVDVSGTCQANTIVEVYKNGILGGSTPCLSGIFGVQVDLIIGANGLKARTVDNLHQYGPDSAVVNVTYKPVSPVATNSGGSSSSTGSASASTGSKPAVAQLIISTDSAYYGVNPHSTYTLNLIIAGGQAPYAVNVQWGDGAQEVVSQTTAGRFSLTHSYDHGDIYYVTINASDASGNKAFTQTTVLVSSAAAASGSAAGGSKNGNSSGSSNSVRSTVDLIWPVYVAVFFALSTFWLGERYQRKKLLDLWKTSHPM